MNVESQKLYDRAKAHIIQSAEIKHQVADKCLEPIVNAAQTIADIFRKDEN